MGALTRTAGGQVAVAVDQAVPVIETRGISKHYGRVQALRGVDLALHRGEVVGLVGDNGAGKSTFVEILSGATAPSGGEVLIDGQRAVFSSPTEARARGIETVYQDLALALDLSIWANVFLGRERRLRGPLGRLGWLDKRQMAAETQRELAAIGLDLGRSDKACRLLSGGERQAVAVARAVAWGTRVILMDEPTAALAVEEQGRVEHLIYQIRDRGIPVLLVSHNLPEVHRICDRIVVLRLGQLVADVVPSQVTLSDIVMWLTGASDGQRKSGAG